jgi:hypothetical protein
MMVTDKTRWLAVHRIFLANRVDAGATLPLKTLNDEWKHSGLRQNDLPQGLESLIRSKYLRLERGPDGPRLRLLDESFGLIGASPADERALETLQLLRQRRRVPEHLRPHVVQPSGRRTGDTKKPN